MKPEATGDDRVITVDHIAKFETNTELISIIIRPSPTDNPQQLRVLIRNKETKTEAWLVFTDEDGERTLSRIDGITSYARYKNKQKAKQITDKNMHFPFRVIRNELNRLLEYYDGDFGHVASLPDTKVGGRLKVITDSFLLDIAHRCNEYSKFADSVHEYLAMDDDVKNRSRANDYVRRAREAGLLEPTSPGKKNWNLTPKAKKLLAQRKDNNGKGNR